jgi:MSHA type pilus biogenesis protein MshL
MSTWKWSILLAALLMGCATAPPKVARAPEAAPVDLAPVPALQMPEVIAIQQPPAEVAATREPTYSLALQNASVRDVLMAFSKKSRYNIVIDPDVAGTVSVDLKAMTLKQALQAVLEPLRLTCRQEGNLIRVSRERVESKVFDLNYITTVRKGSSEVSAMSSSSTQGGGNTTTGGGGGSSGGGGGGGNQGSSTVTSTDEFNLWKDVAEGLKRTISEGGDFAVNTASSTILVRDYPSNFPRIARYLETIEAACQRQVLIDAEIIELTLSNDFQFGIDWNLAGYKLGAFSGALTGGRLFQQALSPGAGLIQFGLASNHASILVDALSKQGELHVLSRPKLTTLNNQKAIIKVGRENVFFQVVIQTDLTTGFRTETATPQTITEGVTLDVTPQISSDHEVVMNIHPVVTEPAGTATSRLGDTAPIVDIREATTVAKVADGQTLVIAGLMRDRRNEEITGVPCLMNLPYLGAAFRKTHQEHTKTELVILLTPHIMYGAEARRLTEAEVDRLKEDRIGPHLGDRVRWQGAPGELELFKGDAWR